MESAFSLPSNKENRTILNERIKKYQQMYLCYFTYVVGIEHKNDRLMSVPFHKAIKYLDNNIVRISKKYRGSNFDSISALYEEALRYIFNGKKIVYEGQGAETEWYTVRIKYSSKWAKFSTFLHLS